MHSAQAGTWNPRPPSKHASPLPQPPQPNSHPAHVTTPAKRLTFYKSGDSRFGGIRMAVHKRSFKCFDALLDDLSQKMPLPFGVRTVTTPRGTHTINHLEQLQDGGCYLCSDRRQAKPVNMELASKRPNIWYHHSQRPHRPEASSMTTPNHLPYRQRRILLVKNSEPGMRRSVVLSRRSARSLRAFLDEVSEVMQFHVRKLYTAEGRRIDSVQSLMTGPGLLVCVGREAFSPMLVNFIRKSSEEKLPGLGTRSPGLGPRTPGNGARSPATQGARSPPHGAQSRASEYSEGHENKKNVNFGLETKKSIIHPRSDSSNRSARFSLSSDKSYGNGLSTYSQARPGITNEDIEKRVLVNKDGSLSVEMRVRFRLHNEETLQWSTQIKKSPSLTNECSPLSEAQSHYLQHGQSESCSDPDSTSFDREGVDYSSRPVQHVSEGNRCPCCYQRPQQQYDLWENPAHSHKRPPVPPPHTSSHTHTVMRHTHSSSSNSSSCHSRRVVRCRARLSNCGGESGSEQGQLVQGEMCVTEQVESRVAVEQGGDTHVEVCRTSCCSRSEVVAVESSLRPLSRRSVEEESGERPLSAVSSSSHILQSLKEDLDDDLSASASQCCCSDGPSPVSGKPKSNASAGSVHSRQDDRDERGSATASAASFRRRGTATPRSRAEAEETDRAPSAKSRTSRASCRSSKANTPKPEEEGAADDEEEEVKRVVSSLSGHTSRTSSVCPDCGGCKREVSNSRASQRSHHSVRASPKPATPLSNQKEASDASDDDGSDASAVSTQSNKTNLTNQGRCSAVPQDRASGAMSPTSDPEATGREEERTGSAASATSRRSNKSHKSDCNGSTGVAERSASAMSAQSNGTAEAPDIKTSEDAEGELDVERALSSLSAKSGASSKTSASVKLSITVSSPTDKKAPEDDERASSALSGKTSASKERADSVLSAKSAKSNVSGKSGASRRSACSKCSRAVSPAAEEPVIEAAEEEEGGEAEERAASAMSVKSRAASQMSGKSNKSSKSVQSNCNGIEESELGNGERAASAGSSKSHKSKSKESAGAGSDVEDEKEDPDRAASALSAKSASSAKSHRSHCDAGSRRASPAKADQLTSTEDRSPSAASAKSQTSAKSSKSQKSNRTAASPDPEEADGPETNGGETQSQERGASAMSVKSKSSVRSRTSHKSNPSENVPHVTIKTEEEVDEDGNDATDRAVSPASANSGTSNVSSAVSHKSCKPRGTRSQQTSSPKAPASTPSSPQPPVQQLLPGPGVGETRGPSALSVRSIKSNKSGRSKCSCGAASANREKEEVKGEEASEQAASVLSSSTKRQRRESGGTERPLSRNSSGSVSLGLPEDHEVAESDSGKSNVSFVTERKSRMKTPDAKSREQSAMKDDVEGSGSTISQKSKNNGSKSTNPPAVDIPTIETTQESVDKGEDDGEQRASSAKSHVSHKSSCNCSVKESGKGSVKSASSTKAGNADKRTSSAASNFSKNANEAESTPDDDTENQAASRPSSMVSGREDIKSPCCLRPESAASAQSKSKSSGKKSQRKETPIKSSSPCLIHNKVETQSESTLSHSLSAADLLKEAMAADILRSRQSKTSKTSDRPRSDRSKRSRKKAGQEELDLTPACLPNASPSEVVSDWLRSIPANSSMLAFGDEEEQESAEEVKEAAKEESPEDEEEKAAVKEEDEKEEEAEGDEAAVEEERGPGPGPAPADGAETSRRINQLLSGGSLPKNWQCSAAVMKTLLSSSLGRCQSLPEVSPVYGRRLSTSARGFLDCLAQLQLIEPAMNPGCDQHKNGQYEDIMAILQSLWLTEPRDVDFTEPKEVSPPRSSSGVGMSSGSGGSGKENVNQGGDETEQNKTEQNGAGSPREDEGVQKVAEEEEEEEEGNAEAGPNEIDADEELRQSAVPPSLDSPKATENASSSDKSSPNDSSPTDNEQETLEDSSSGTPPTVLRAPMSKRLSQDPDPVWILHLLKKLEKQFISHYVNAMAEFKVRWDLDDSLILDTMICELRDEVSRRIQSSIEREMRKIQSRAGRMGRSPRPPKGSNLSRESTMTERRRQMLRVMKNQSVKTADSFSDEDMTADFSDQRSDDEYCPCDACVRKKMAAKPLKTNPLAAEAPVMMDFDLLKILQLKKSPSPCLAAPPLVEEDDPSTVEDEEGRNLEVLQEEEEEEDETKEDIKADLVLEETILEEDEEIERDGEEEAREEEEVEEGKEENSGDDEEEEEVGEKGSEDAGEEETSENEGEEAQCQCQCGQNEEDTGGEVEEGEGDTAEGGEDEEASEKTGEGENAEDEGETEDLEGKTEEESDKEETGKETTADEGETTGNEKCEEEEEEEEEETTGRGSSEEEAPGETENVSHEESTPAEEFVEAEDEDEGDEGTGEEEPREDAEEEEQDREASEEEERASPQGQGVTEGEEADAEESDTDGKRPSDTSADESGREGAAGDEEPKEDEGDGGEEEEEVGEDAVEEIKAEEEEEEKSDKREDGVLLHQLTRTSVESQPGSLEDIDTDSPQNSIEVPKTPARVKRCKPKEV